MSQKKVVQAAFYEILHAYNCSYLHGGKVQLARKLLLNLKRKTKAMCKTALWRGCKYALCVAWKGMLRNSIL